MLFSPNGSCCCSFITFEIFSGLKKNILLNILFFSLDRAIHYENEPIYSGAIMLLNVSLFKKKNLYYSVCSLFLSIIY
jgi:hypothetical protein